MKTCQVPFSYDFLKFNNSEVFVTVAESPAQKQVSKLVEIESLPLILTKPGLVSNIFELKS